MREDRALVVALELLRKKLGDLPDLIGIAANTNRTKQEFDDQAKSIADFLYQRGVTRDQPAQGPVGAAPLAPVEANTEAIKENTVALKALSTWIEHAATGGAGLPTATPVAMPVAPAGALGDDPGKGGIESAENKKARDQKTAAADKAAAGRGAQAASRVMANPLVQVLSQVAQKFAAILSPMAVLQAAMNSTTSGFGLMSTAVKLVAVPLSAVFLPVTLALSAGLIALSGSLMDHLPVLDQFSTMILAVLIPSVTFLVGVIDSAADHIQEMQEAADDFAEWVKSAGLNSLPGGGIIDELLGKSAEDVNYDFHKERVDTGMRDALQSLRQQIGPRAQITGLESVGRNLQTSALNGDPLEIRLQRDQLKVLESIDRKVSRKRGPAPSLPFATDETGGIAGMIGGLLGAAGDAGGGDF